MENVLILVVVVALAWLTFRCPAMARTTWAAYWGVLALMFCVSFFRPRPEQGDLAVRAAFGGLMNAGVWGLVLLPLFLLGAWVRRRIVHPSAGQR